MTSSVKDCMFHKQSVKREDLKKAQWERRYGPQGPLLAFDTTKELAQLARLSGDRAKSSLGHHRSTLPGVQSRQERRSASVIAGRGISRQENPGFGKLATPRFARKVQEVFKSHVVPAWAKGRSQFDHINVRDDSTPPQQPQLDLYGSTGPRHARRVFEKLPPPRRPTPPRHPLHPAPVPGNEAEILMDNLHILDRHAALEREEMQNVHLNNQVQEFNNRHAKSHGDTGEFVFRPGVKKWVMPARTKANTMQFRQWNDHVNSTWHYKVSTQN